MKKINLLFLLVLILNPIVNLADKKDTSKSGVNDQTFATELAKTEVDLSLASGWYNDESSIFTTLYDEYGKYRGYRTTQIFKNGVKDATLEDYNENGAKVCSVFEMNTIDVEYEGSTHQAIDFICTQEVGNQNVAKVEGNKITLNKGYGKADGYLVGVSVRNKTFNNVKGGEVANDVVYIIDNNGGSADIVDIKASDKSEKDKSDTTKSSDINYIAIISCIIALIVLVVLFVVLIKKVAKKGKIKPKKDKNQVDSSQLEQNSPNNQEFMDNQGVNGQDNTPDSYTPPFNNQQVVPNINNGNQPFINNTDNYQQQPAMVNEPPAQAQQQPNLPNGFKVISEGRKDDDIYG